MGRPLEEINPLYVQASDAMHERNTLDTLRAGERMEMPA